jgi:hypothetical protein
MRVAKVLPATAAAATTAATAAPATTAATAVAAAATTAVATATASAAAAATTAILSFLHGDLTSLDVAAVDLFDRLAGLILGRHLDEAEAARTSRFAIRDDLRVRHGADAAEQVAKIQLGDGVR